MFWTYGVRSILLKASVLICLVLPSSAVGEPRPGDIFAEYLWRGPHRNADGWQRVTHPDTENPRARFFLPNPINRIEIDDLDGAIAAEVVIQQWGGHTGTTQKAMRINELAWLPVAHPEAIPGDNGREGAQNPECYQYFTYPIIPVPLEHLVEGENFFEFTSGDQLCLGFGWGQWGVYSVVFRIYYSADKPHPTGRIISPASGAAVGDSLPLEAIALSPNGAISSVDFIGHYEDYDHDGDGIWREWQYIYQRGRLKRHLGSATELPFKVAWNTEWIPDQDEPMAIMARIGDESGIYYMTEAVDHLSLDRSAHSVGMYKPYQVPPGWISRAGRGRGAQVFVPTLSAARDARALITTWSGGHAEAIRLNGITLVPRVGAIHDYGHDAIEVPLDLLRPGANSFSTFSSTLHHGIEVMWPGITLLVRYAEPRKPVLPAREDLVIFADGMLDSWAAVTPDDGAARAEDRDDAFEGGRVLHVVPSRSFNALLDLTSLPPQPTAGYKSLRLAIHPLEMQVKKFHRLDLVVWDQPVPLLKRGVGLRGLDFGRSEWQTLEIPLAEFDFLHPYLETLHFDGLLDGAFLIDDVRLVAGDAGTAVIDRGGVLPESLRLHPNAPNPFNAGTVISFDLAQAGMAKLSVYNLAGQKVTTIIEGALLAGRHSYLWDSRAADGGRLASGVYVYRLDALGEHRTGKLLLLQ
jgi:hypothetical protein